MRISLLICQRGICGRGRPKSEADLGIWNWSCLERRCPAPDVTRVEEAAIWLARYGVWTGSICGSHSGVWKHYIEPDLTSGYLSQGEFILAALRFPETIIKPQGEYCLLNLSLLDTKKRRGDTNPVACVRTEVGP
jgi:hypothetical protein